MKHAGSSALDRLEAMIARLRPQPGLKEKGRGGFYPGRKAFLHFPGAGGGPFADVRLAGRDFERFRVETEGERDALLAIVYTGAPPITSRSPR